MLIPENKVNNTIVMTGCFSQYDLMDRLQQTYYTEIQLINDKAIFLKNRLYKSENIFYICNR